MRIALVTILCLFARAAGAEPVKPELTADVLVRSSREAPPQRFLDVLAELRGMGVALRKGVPAQGWAPKAPCGDQAPRCSTLPFCVGLRTAYWSELVGKPFGYRFDVLAWTYDTRESAKRARDHLRGGPTFYIQHVEVLADSDTTLLLLVGRWPDAHVFERVGRQLRKRLGQADPVAAAVGATRKCAKPRPALDRLLSPDVTDADLPELAAAPSACEPTGSEKVSQTLNTRGMRFYKAKDYARADAAFALAMDFGWSPKPAYNRACVAALRGDADTAAWMLWEILYTRGEGDYAFEFEPTAVKQALRALADKDFTGVRSAPMVGAVMECVRNAPNGRARD